MPRNASTYHMVLQAVLVNAEADKKAAQQAAATAKTAEQAVARAKVQEEDAAAALLFCVLVRHTRMRARITAWESAQVLQAAARRSCAVNSARETRVATVSVQATLRKRLTCRFCMTPHVVVELVRAILDLVEGELSLRRHPFQGEWTGKRRSSRMSHGKVMVSMQKWMADLGRSMSRYVSSKALKMARQHPNECADTLVPIMDMSDDSSPKRSGGMSYHQVTAMQRKKWPSKQDFARKHQESLDTFHSRMRFMQDRREWERLHSTSRLDPLFRTGTGAPIMRQKSTEFPVFFPASAGPSVESAWSAPDLGQGLSFQRSQGKLSQMSHQEPRRLPWKQEPVRPDPPMLIPPARQHHSALDMGWRTAHTEPSKSPRKTRPNCLMQHMQPKEAKNFWQGIENTQDTKDKERLEEEAEELNIYNEARTLFDTIDKDGSGTLEEVLSLFLALHPSTRNSNFTQCV